MDSSNISISTTTPTISTKFNKTEYYKQWKEENPEKLKNARKTWYENHKNSEEYKAKRRDYQREYYKKNKKSLDLSQMAIEFKGDFIN